MTPAVTYLTPEDAAMWSAAGLAQLPRMPSSLVKAAAEPAGITPVVTSGSDETPARPTSPCGCGCGEPVARARTGWDGLYPSHACRQRAYRRRGAVRPFSLMNGYVRLAGR